MDRADQSQVTFLSPSLFPRYGPDDHWLLWRATGRRNFRNGSSDKLELQGVHLCGNSRGEIGLLYSIATIDHNGKIKAVGRHEQLSYNSRRLAPPAPFTLSYLSGDQTNGKWLVRFNYQ